MVLLDHPCNELDEQDQEDHRNRIDRGIGYAGSRAVGHRIGCCQSGCAGHSSGNGSEQVEDVYFEYPVSEHQGDDHRNEGDSHSDAKQGPAAFLERGNQVTSGRCADFAQEEQQTELAQELVGRSGHTPDNGAGLSDGA